MADVERLVAELTLDEKTALTAGADLWSTVAVPRLGIPSVRVTDGPNGARGTTVAREASLSSVCTPCGSALGATWDPELVGAVGEMLGDETRSKACRVLLAPTVNIHRSPLSGRNFEAYSEDPLLAGRLAAAFVRGVQARGVATTVKHFAGNEAEFERHTIDSQIDERPLREIYLLPFELAVREGGALGVMTAYNRLNGPWCAEHRELIHDILRDEWGFPGLVLTDWGAVASTVASAEAGLDLEMPGPGRAFGPRLAAAVRAGEVDEASVDAQVRRLLGVFDRIGALDDGGTEPVGTDLPAHRALARRAASDAMVLLANDGILPIDLASVRTIAVIGPNADRAQIMGGGSANVLPHYLVTPLQAIRERAGETDILHEAGLDIDRTVPLLAGPHVTAADGRPGLDLEVIASAGGEPVHRSRRTDSRLFFVAEPAEGVALDDFALRASGRLTPSESGAHTFALVQAGRARLLVDGVPVLDGVTEPPPPGNRLAGLVSEARTAQVELQAGRAVDVVIEYESREPGRLRGVEIGWRRPSRPDGLERAERAAAASDLAIVVVGTTDEWESEGRDRRSMDLPGAQDELIERVIDANPDTVVVLNTGAPVTMDWAPRARAVLQMWFGGQEMAHALVDILTGVAEPGGRLPTTFPLRLEHNPSFGNFPGENGRVRYGEGVLVGYRWYDARRLPTRFPFGHGLSYTTFEIGPPALSTAELARGDTLTVSVPVTNTGNRRGAEVVQCYVAPPRAPVVRPPQELKAFAKVWLDPGETSVVTLQLDGRAFSYWNPGDPGATARYQRLAATGTLQRAPRVTPRGWTVEPGVYELRIGCSSVDLAHVAEVTVTEGSERRAVP